MQKDDDEGPLKMFNETKQVPTNYTLPYTIHMLSRASK